MLQLHSPWSSVCGNSTSSLKLLGYSWLLIYWRTWPSWAEKFAYFSVSFPISFFTDVVCKRGLESLTYCLIVNRYLRAIQHVYFFLCSLCPNESKSTICCYILVSVNVSYAGFFGDSTFVEEYGHGESCTFVLGNVVSKSIWWVGWCFRVLQEWVLCVVVCIGPSFALEARLH